MVADIKEIVVYDLFLFKRGLFLATFFKWQEDML
jgi:hypothetical protein